MLVVIFRNNLDILFVACKLFSQRSRPTVTPAVPCSTVVCNFCAINVVRAYVQDFGLRAAKVSVEMFIVEQAWWWFSLLSCGTVAENNL